MTGKLFGAAALSAVLVAGVMVHSGVMLVDVQEADGAHLVIPVPLAIARAGLAFAPNEAKYIHAPRVAEYLPHADRAVDALRDAPDGLLLEVEDGDAHVTIVKEGDVLRVRAIDGPGSSAEMTIPLRSAEAALRAYDRERGHFRTSKLVSALGAAPHGEIVNVVDGEDRVRIRRLF